MSTKQPVLEIRDVVKQFSGFVAVDGVSLDLKRGERRALIGPNGAGKTTLFNLISGQLRPDRGEIRYLGQPIQNLSPPPICRLGLARTFQITSVYPRLTGLQNVQIALFARHKHSRWLFRSAARTDVDEAMHFLADVGLEHLATSTAGFLSYGDQKRLELAIALAMRPMILLLDEPTAGMESNTRLGIVGLVKRLCKEHELTLLFCEHDMDAVFSISDRITVMHQGKVFVEGSADEVRNNDTVRAIYLGSGQGGTS